MRDNYVNAIPKKQHIKSKKECTCSLWINMSGNEMEIKSINWFCRLASRRQIKIITFVKVMLVITLYFLEYNKGEDLCSFVLFLQ